MGLNLKDLCHLSSSSSSSSFLNRNISLPFYLQALIYKLKTTIRESNLNLIPSVNPNLRIPIPNEIPNPTRIHMLTPNPYRRGSTIRNEHCILCNVVLALCGFPLENQDCWAALLVANKQNSDVNGLSVYFGLCERFKWWLDLTKAMAFSHGR